MFIWCYNHSKMIFDEVIYFFSSNFISLVRFSLLHNHYIWIVQSSIKKFLNSTVVLSLIISTVEFFLTWLMIQFFLTWSTVILSLIYIIVKIFFIWIIAIIKYLITLCCIQMFCRNLRLSVDWFMSFIEIKCNDCYNNSYWNSNSYTDN